MKKRKNTTSLEEILSKNIDKTTNKEKYARKYKTSYEKARAQEQEINKKSSGKYSLRTRIRNNPWLGNRPASQAIRWLYKEVFKNPDKYKYRKRMLYQGGLFIFEYKNPKYKDTSVLPYFDKYQLVISLGPRITDQGPRNIGFNLHLLPPRIRIIVLCYIFELWKNSYRYGIFFKKDIYPVNIDYQSIVDVLEKFGVKFSVRMYIPMRMNQIVHFPVNEWYKAIFIPSRGYYDIRASKLIREWKDYCKKNHYNISPNINWKNMI